MTTQVNTMQEVQTKNVTEIKNVAEIGEDIGLDLGLKMVKDYFDANPNYAYGNVVGKNILLQILAQPGCEAINFYPALNEDGSRTLVYLGLDRDGNEMTKFVMVTEDGSLEIEEGIIGDKAKNKSWFS